MKILNRNFYKKNTIEVAQKLLGKILIYKPSTKFHFSAKIVETEAYLENDPASHSFCGITPRNAPMFGPPGFTYIYIIYGMYNCLNFVTEQNGKAGAVLIRAVEPIEGIPLMKKNRHQENLYNLTSGPGKLCQALNLTRDQNQLDLCIALKQKKITTKYPQIYLLDAKSIPEELVIATSRIGIKEEHQQPWRYYIKGNRFVSRGCRKISL